MQIGFGSRTAAQGFAFAVPAVEIRSPGAGQLIFLCQLQTVVNKFCAVLGMPDFDAPESRFNQLREHSEVSVLAGVGKNCFSACSNCTADCLHRIYGKFKIDHALGTGLDHSFDVIRVDVDESRKEIPAFPIDDLCLRIPVCQVLVGDLLDPAALHQHTRMVQNTVRQHRIDIFQQNLMHRFPP